MSEVTITLSDGSVLPLEKVIELAEIGLGIEENAIDKGAFFPAKPLAELKNGQDYWLVVGPGLIRLATNWEHVKGQRNCDEGRAFPYTPEGKAGAELRAKEGLIQYPVTPAKALTEPLEVGERYWLAESVVNIGVWKWEGNLIEFEWLKQGRCFPFTTAGKLGAALYQPSNSES